MWHRFPINTPFLYSLRINQKSDQDTSVNLEAELNQLEIIKNKQLITSEEYVVMRKNLLGL